MRGLCSDLLLTSGVDKRTPSAVKHDITPSSKQMLLLLPPEEVAHVPPGSTSALLCCVRTACQCVCASTATREKEGRVYSRSLDSCIDP